jgi:hypothetical protein
MPAMPGIPAIAAGAVPLAAGALAAGLEVAAGAATEEVVAAGVDAAEVPFGACGNATAPMANKAIMVWMENFILVLKVDGNECRLE